jgi:hypothetical protein
MPFPPVETGGYFWDVPTGHDFGFSPGVGEGTPGEAKKRPSSKRCVVIPDLIRNPES